MKPLSRKPHRPKDYSSGFCAIGDVVFGLYAVASRLSFALRDGCHVAAACMAATGTVLQCVFMSWLVQAACVGSSPIILFIYLFCASYLRT